MASITVQVPPNDSSSITTDKSTETPFTPELISDYFFNEPASPLLVYTADQCSSPIDTTGAHSCISINSCSTTPICDTNIINQNIQQWPSNSTPSLNNTCSSPANACDSPACIPSYVRHYSATTASAVQNRLMNVAKQPYTPVHSTGSPIYTTPSPSSSLDSNSEYVGPFRLGPVLGRGCTGTVRLGTHKYTGFEVAFKIIEKKYLNSDEKLWKKVKREIVILKLVEHPNVLKLYDVLETETKLYLVLEHIKGGELFDYIVSKGRLDRHEALRLTAQIIMGLEHCHSHSICHRDLKPENLLLDDKLNIKIADFGMAQLMKQDTRLKTSCGSPHYASPEIIEGGTYDAKKTDVWSIGVILYALITGSLPFDHDNIPTLLQMVCRGQYTTPSFVQADVAHLISRMLTVDPNRRILLEQIKEHAVYKNSKFNYFTPSPIIYSSTVQADIPEETEHDVEQYNTVQTPRKRKNHDLNSVRGKRQHNSMFESHNDSTVTHSDTDSDTGDTDKDVEEQVLKDLESLGWGNRDELRSRVLTKTAQHSAEREFYKLLKRRRHERLQQLSVLSPKVSLSRAESAPITYRNNFPFTLHHHHHHSVSTQSPVVSNTKSPNSVSIYSSNMNTPVPIKYNEYERTPTSVYASPAIMPTLTLTPQTGPIQYQSVTSTIHHRVQPAEAVKVELINSIVLNKQSNRLPSLELGASAVYQRIVDSDSSDTEQQHSTAGKTFNTPSLKLVNDHSEADIQVFHVNEMENQSSESTDSAMDTTVNTITTQYAQREASTSKPSSRRLFETYRNADVSDDDDSSPTEQDNDSDTGSSTTNQQIRNSAVDSNVTKSITPRNQQRISIRVPSNTDTVYRNTVQPTPKYKVTESPRFHRLHYSPMSPSTQTPISTSVNHARHRSEDYTHLPQFMRQHSTPIPGDNTTTNATSATTTTTSNKKKSWFSSLFGSSTTYNKQHHKHRHSESIDVRAPQHITTGISTVNSTNNHNNSVSTIISDKSSNELVTDIRDVLDRMNLQYNKLDNNTYECIYDTTKSHSTPYNNRKLNLHSTTNINSPSKPPTHNRRSTLSTLQPSQTPTAKQLHMTARHSRDSGESYESNKPGIVSQFVASMKHFLPVTSTADKSANKYTMNDSQYVRARSYSMAVPTDGYNEFNTYVGKHTKQHSEPPLHLSTDTTTTTPTKYIPSNDTHIHGYGNKHIISPNTPKHDTIHHQNKESDSNSSNDSMTGDSPVKFIINVNDTNEQYRSIEFQLVEGDNIQYHNVQHTVQTLLGL